MSNTSVSILSKAKKKLSSLAFLVTIKTKKLPYLKTIRPNIAASFATNVTSSVLRILGLIFVSSSALINNLKYVP